MVSRTVEGMATGTAEIVVTMTAENTVIKIGVGTKNSIKWMTDRDLMSEFKEGGGGHKDTCDTKNDCPA